MKIAGFDVKNVTLLNIQRAAINNVQTVSLLHNHQLIKFVVMLAVIILGIAGIHCQLIAGIGEIIFSSQCNH